MGGFVDREGEKKIVLRKKAFGAISVDNLLDRKFKEFGGNTVNRDIELMFKIYNDTFYDIAKQGENSHTTLRVRSGEFIADFKDPRDTEIERLNEEIDLLQSRILQLEASGAAELAGLGSEIGAIASELEDIEEEIQAELDELTLSNTTPPHYLIKGGTGDTELDGLLQDRNCPYYYQEHWGKEVWRWHPKRGEGKDKNTIVVYDGARGGKGDRYLVRMDNQGEFKVSKGRWNKSTSKGWKSKIWSGVNVNTVEEPPSD